MALRWNIPFLPSAEGALQFNYGARTIRLATGLDEAEGQLIVDRIKRSLPQSALAERR